MRVLDKQCHEVPNDQYVDGHLSDPHHVNVRDGNLDVPPNGDGVRVQRAPNDEPSDGRNDDGVGVDSAQPHS